MINARPKYNMKTSPHFRVFNESEDVLPEVGMWRACVLRAIYDADTLLMRLPIIRDHKSGPDKIKSLMLLIFHARSLLAEVKSMWFFNVCGFAGLDHDFVLDYIKKILKFSGEHDEIFDREYLLSLEAIYRKFMVRCNNSHCPVGNACWRKAKKSIKEDIFVSFKGGYDCPQLICTYGRSQAQRENICQQFRSNSRTS